MLDGWYEEAELDLLEECARLAPRNDCMVEVGVAHGRSAARLARVTEMLHLVDDLSLVDGRATWPPAAGYYRTVEEMSARVPTIGLLHHDADHTHEVVRDHLLLLLPKMTRNSFVCLHDFASATYPGVRSGWLEASRATMNRLGIAWRAHRAAGTLQTFQRAK